VQRPGGARQAAEVHDLHEMTQLPQVDDPPSWRVAIGFAAGGSTNRDGADGAGCLDSPP